MKRVGIVFAIFFIAVQVICANEPFKYYSDWETGYKGYAKAEYIGKGDSERYLEELEKAKEELQKVYLDGKYDVSDILKLTKEDLWLCRSALSEYDLEDREIYLVYWYRTPDQDTVKFLIAVIKDNGNSFDYYFAKAVTEKE
jgi:hypothetical protein